MTQFGIDLAKELEHERKNQEGIENAEDALRKAHEIKPLKEAPLKQWMVVLLILVCFRPRKYQRFLQNQRFHI